MLLRIYDVILNSSIHEWEPQAGYGKLDHKNIRTLHIVINEIDRTNDSYWDATFYNNQSKSVEVAIQYAGKSIACYPFSILSNNGLILPMPRSGSNKISSKQMNLSKILNAVEDISEYMDAYNLEVCESLFT